MCAITYVYCITPRVMNGQEIGIGKKTGTETVAGTKSVLYVHVHVQCICAFGVFDGSFVIIFCVLCNV